jgi:hypothetical protein
MSGKQVQLAELHLFDGCRVEFRRQVAREVRNVLQRA